MPYTKETLKRQIMCDIIEFAGLDKFVQTFMVEHYADRIMLLIEQYERWKDE
jgi:hypothetical protein